MKRNSWVFAVLGVLVLLSGVGYLGFSSSAARQAAEIPLEPPTVGAEICDVSQTVTSPGNLINFQEITLQMPASGFLEQIIVRPGDRVQKGQVLAVLGNREAFEAAVNTAELELLKARQALEELKQNSPIVSAQAQLALVNAQKELDEAEKQRQRLDYPRANQMTIEGAKAQLALMEERLEQARNRYEEVDHLSASDPENAQSLQDLTNAQRERDKALATLNWYLGHPSEAEFAEADARVELAKALLKAAEEKWERLKDGPDELMISLAEAQVEDTEIRLAQSRTNLESMEVLAPFDGVVLEVNARAGETLAAGVGLIVLQAPSALEVEASVTEEDMPFIQAGQPVELFFDALPDSLLSGTVDRILPKRAGGDRPLYNVYIQLDEVPEALVAGMTVDGSIAIAQSKQVLCLPRTLVKASSGDTATVEVWDGEHIEERTIEVGLRGDVNVEILSGLKEGELVVSR